MANPGSPTDEEEEEEEEELDPHTIAFLKTCNAGVLSKQLSHHRFANRPSETTAFLQEAFQHAEKAALEVAMTQPNEASVDFDTTSSSPSVMLLSEPMETSLLTPRMGKVKIQLSANGLLATRLSTSNTSQQQHLHLPTGAVSHLIVFPKPEDCKLIKNKNNKAGQKNHLLKVKGHVVLLKLKETVPFQGKEIDQLCFALPWNKTDGCTGPKLVVEKKKKSSSSSSRSSTNGSDDDSGGNDNGDDNDDDDDDDDDDSDDGTPAWKMAADGWRKVLTQALQPSQPTSSNDSDDNDGNDDEEEEEAPPQMKVTQVRVNSTVFTSHIEMGTSTTTSGMPFVSCNRGVQDGVLYPLKQGLLFFKPPRFLPVSDMEEIMFGRGASAGQSSSRYVDLAIVLKPKQDEAGDDKLLPKDQIEEFSNILCQEEGALQVYNGEYILPFLQKKKKNSSSNNGSGDEDDTDDSEAVRALAEDTDDDTDADDEDFDQAKMLEEEEEDETDDDETDDDDEGGIPMGTDEWMNELRKEAEQNPKRNNIIEEEFEEDDSGSDERTKRRTSKRFKR